MSGTISDPVSVQDVARMLRRDAEVLARQLLPDGKLRLGEWKVSGSQSPTGAAISVHIASGPKQGLCGFWDSETGGDMLDLIEAVNGCSKHEAIAWAKEWLGIPDEAPATRRNLRQKPKVKKPRVEPEPDEAERRNTAYAGRIWRESSPLSGAAASYLRFRGLDPTFAEDLRSAPSLRYPTGQSFPALLGRVEDASMTGIGVWRIYVKINGDGKAPVDEPKLGLGRFMGGAVRLGGIASEIGVTEGIETAVAVRQLIHSLIGRKTPVWAALSASGLAALELPPEVQSIRIYADADPERLRRREIKPSPGMKAAAALAERAIAKGVRVIVEEPPVGMDWLEVFLGQKSAA